MPKLTPLHMGNITDDETEELLNFARHISSLKRYGEPAEWEEGEPDDLGDDAMCCLNQLIEQAREIIIRKNT